MSILISLKDNWLKIPQPIRKIIVVGALILVVWRGLYTFWLQPGRLLDAPLTSLVIVQTTSVMQFIQKNEQYSILNDEEYKRPGSAGVVKHWYIAKNGQPVISIADNCNGLELMVLYAAFIACMPGKISRKIWFILAGIPIIHFSNILRCMGLIGVHIHWPGMFDFAHHYLFKIVVYTISFALWVAYLKAPVKKTEKVHAA